MNKSLNLSISLIATGLLLIQALPALPARATAPEVVARVEAVPTVPLAGLSEEVTVHSAGRGNPWINLADGRSLITSYVGEQNGMWALENNQARGLSLASDDFDEEGTADLVCGYAAADGSGIIALHRGNVDSIYPNSMEAQLRRKRREFTDAPFLSPARVFEIPEAPEFLGAGDFDADGHRDVVAASSTSEALYLMKGDGQGGLAEPERIELPGRVTAMTVGEINRADGLEDVIVGVNGFNGPQALVFEGPNGALRSEPEVIILPAEASSLAIGQLDSSYEYDLAIAAGNELLIVNGRDRKLLHKQLLGVEVEPATMSRKQFPFSIASLAIGEFVVDGVHSPDIAVMSEDGRVQYLRQGDAKTRGGADKWQVMNEVRVAEIAPHTVSAGRPVLAKVKVSSLATDDLVVIDRASNQMQTVSGGPGSRRPFHEINALYVEGEEATAVLPMRLNRDALSDLVILKSNQVSPSVVVTPAATILVTNTNDSGPGSLRQAILDANSMAGADEIRFSIGTGLQTISPTSDLPRITETVTIDATSQPGFSIIPLVELDGRQAGLRGLNISAANVVVRGLVVNSFPSDGIQLFQGGNNIIELNFLGTNATGTTGRGNGEYGLSILDSPGNTIKNNLISGNNRRPKGLTSSSGGVDIFAAGSTENRLQSNKIGADFSGSSQIGNTIGVRITEEAFNNTVGGTEGSRGNLISGNRAGVQILRGARGNLVLENLIGTNLTGDRELKNDEAFLIFRASNNTIGGNTISGNDSSGIRFEDSAENQVIGNFIGTDISGARPVPNRGTGVSLTTVSSNLITLNTIAFNRFGVFVLRGEGQFITTNSIHSNRDLGIDLRGSPGVTPNDGPGDPDGGANKLQNFPVLVAEKDANGECKIKGVLESTPNTTFRIELFANRERDPSGHGEGETFLGSIMVTTDPNGRAEFATGIPADSAPFISATATDPDGNTSEFSPIIRRCADLTVTTTADGGPGSFRIALEDGGVIEFNIPQTDSGFDSNTGTWKMLPQVPLTPVTKPTVIDGDSQPDPGGTTMPGPRIKIDGAMLPSTTPGLQFGPGSKGSVLTGVAFTNFRSFGVVIFNTNNVTVSNPSFTNNANGIGIFGASRNTLSSITSSNNTGLGVGLINDGPFQGGGSNIVNGSLLTQNGLEGLRIFESPRNVVLNTTVSTNGDGGSVIGSQATGNTFVDNVLTNNMGAGLGMALGASNTLITRSIFTDNAIGIGLSPSAGQGNRFLFNRVLGNSSLGIDFGFNRQPDPSGVPTLTSATQTNSTQIEGTFRGRPNATYTIEFYSNVSCHPSGFGEGEFPLDSVAVTTDGSGNAIIDVPLDATIPAGQFVTATATGEVEGTSEFSRCVLVAGAAQPDVSLTKAGPGVIAVGQIITYTLEVKNLGQASALGVTVTDDLPACLNNVFCTSSQGDCTVLGNSVTADLGSIEPDNSATVTIIGEVSGACGAEVSNTGRVTAASDTNPGNDTSSVSSRIQPGPTITRLKLKANNKLVVTGENFQPGARIFVQKQSGEEIEANKTKFKTGSKLVGKGVMLQPGDSVIVRNADGSSSAPFNFTG